MSLARAAALAPLLLSLVGCDKAPKPKGDGAAPVLTVIPPPSSSVDTSTGAAPIPPELIASTNNPSKLPAYSGPFGAIEGTITYKGPPPEAEPQELPIPSRCADAREMYAKKFRVSPTSGIGDAIVAVTGFEQYVEPVAEAVTVDIHSCAYKSRTIVLAFGQRLEVVNTDDESYVPHLYGAKNPAQMVAVPHGAPVKIYPREIGRYRLSDDMRRPWMDAEVFVFKFATHAVTSAAGTYRVERVPPGTVTVGAWHPQLSKSLAPLAKREIVVKAGETLKVDLEISPAVAPAPSASAAKK